MTAIALPLRGPIWSVPALCHIDRFRRVFWLTRATRARHGQHFKESLMTTDTTITADDVVAVEPRMSNPMFVVDGAFAASTAMGKAIAGVGLDPRWTHLINVRASQLNRCGVCLVQHQREALADGVPQEQLLSVAGWQDAPWFTRAERAVLALTEAVTVLDTGVDAVTERLWREVTQVLDEPQVAAVLLQIALINVWNRVNRVSGQVAGQSW